MTEQDRFTDRTKQYLCEFYSILDHMVSRMEQARLTDSLSLNFIIQMIPHHQAAIEMSRNILQYTDSAPLRRIASHIVEEQTQSIRDMTAAECACGALCNSKEDLFLYQRHFCRIVRTMFSGMDTARSTNNLDNSFMREMIPHHRGAIAMSENALRFCICPELHPILEAIIRSQTRGIQEMEALLAQDPS